MALDETTVRGLLKEQQDLVQQQATNFQLQFDALRAELQAALGQIQGRQGGVGDPGALLPRSMRLDVPKFSGEDPDSWIFAINEYFTLLDTSDDQRLRVVGFNLEGDAAEWFRWISRNKLITTWDNFLDSVQNRFGPCKYEDPQGALSKLLQTGTVGQYQGEFEKLMNRVTGISESLVISFYISGLKPTLQRELLVSKPSSLGDVFSLARVTEARLDDQGVRTTTSRSSPTNASQTLTKSTSRFGVLRLDNSKPPLLSTPPKVGVTSGSTPLPIKWIPQLNGRGVLVRVRVLIVITNGYANIHVRANFCC